MIADDHIPAASAVSHHFSPGSIAAFVTVMVGAICLILEPHAPWLVKYPAEWAIPAAEWIGISLGWFLELIKPIMRIFSGALAYPMEWSNRPR